MMAVVVFCIWFALFTALGVGAYLYRNHLRNVRLTSDSAAENEAETNGFSGVLSHGLHTSVPSYETPQTGGQLGRYVVPFAWHSYDATKNFVLVAKNNGTRLSAKIRPGKQRSLKVLAAKNKAHQAILRRDKLRAE
ncbi:hypothetical protein ACI2KX_15935 [Ectopseudomonas khazarica]|uniref:hypothetical protein n=1 Tax=Ectopseudomonas khazarica TaxID=2502979 RepID=UPI00384B6495